MQIRTFIISIILLFYCEQLLAQVDISKLPLIGFACNESGEPSEAVQNADKIIHSQDFDKFTDILINGNAAEQYLAVVVLEFLHEKDLRKISKADKELINKARESRALVAYCSGCTEHYWRMLNELFKGEHISEANHWVSNQFKTD